jgi:transposase-like protein
MPQLVVVEKIDGNPVSWRCSDCRQNFSARGKLTTQQRLEKVNREFKSHLEESHKAAGAARPMSFATDMLQPK